MELTPAEERLIKALREIDAENPLGIDGWTAEYHTEICLKAIGGAAAEAGRRYRLFLEESKAQPLIDITEAQRHKENYEDLRAKPEDKEHYESIYRHYGWRAPKWLTGTAGERKPAAGPRKQP